MAEQKISKPKKKVAEKTAPIETAKAKVEKTEAIAKVEVKAEVHKPAAVKDVVKEVPKVELPAEKGAKKTKGKKAPKKGIKAIVARGKRKEAVARATVRAGKGRISVNKVLLDAYGNPYVREIIREPVRYMGPEVNGVDISVNVFGGGTMGQAQAARTAIANALMEYFDDQNLKKVFLDIDRSLLIDDARRVESKKYRGPKARARYQKSYR
jgi:small subunit ribosomal protein S9